VEYDIEKNIHDLIHAGLPEKIGEIIRDARETNLKEGFFSCPV
jgi:hypothetical protein